MRLASRSRCQNPRHQAKSSRFQEISTLNITFLYKIHKNISHPDVAKALPTWQGKTIVDVTNAYGVPPEQLGGQPSSKFVAQAFTGARLVKGFNHLVAAVLDQDPAVHGGRRVVFLASDDDGAAEEIGALAENLGFSPIKLGGLSEGGLLVQARGNSWGRLIFKDLVKFD